MGSEGVERPEVGSGHKPTLSTRAKWVLPLLRLLAFLATLAATLVMALNKETRKVIVATIGTTSIEATVKARFQHTPAFVFFVIVNGNASLHNLLMLVVYFIRHKFGLKRHAPRAIAILDLLNVALVSGGETAAVFMGQLGRDGNSHARWNKICDKVESFCDRGRAAMIASLAGLLLMIIITIISIIRLGNKNTKLVSSTNVP
ncbi:integral membrane family protein [Dorcoceras hygrometricum]|uniref:CASP-like protein n=1 Tax=Dorcoceras hygrometricum TaxID=472368 RepID=A0A2Z7B5Z4_9LAMI|nr:integral membrane family protein [Dorcoceras hygrometricum]